MGHGKCSWAIEDRKYNNTPSTTGMHVVMTTCGQGFLEWEAGLEVSLNTKYQALVNWTKPCGKKIYQQEPWSPN
jgi:hypothetical protein